MIYVYLFKFPSDKKEIKAQIEKLISGPILHWKKKNVFLRTEEPYVAPVTTEKAQPSGGSPPSEGV